MDIGSSTDAISISILKTANDLALVQARMIYESIPSPVKRTSDVYIPSTPNQTATYSPPTGTSD